jgi:uncharacterized membrane protein
MYHHGMGISAAEWLLIGGMVLVLVIGGILLLGAFLYGIYRRKGLDTRVGVENPAENAFKILNRRYARGEILRDEYHQIKEDLESSGRPRP